VSSVINGIRNVVELEDETNKHLTVVVKTPVPDLEKIRNNLKGKREKNISYKSYFDTWRLL
jgi:hypothetical protein